MPVLQLIFAEIIKISATRGQIFKA